jgi:hypothetical protein
MRQGPEAERYLVARDPCQAVPLRLFGASSLRCRPSLSLDALLDLKTYTPWMITIKGGGET